MSTDEASPDEKVLDLYENSAQWYGEIMDKEIDLPVYADTLSRLAGRIEGIPGPVLDTSCGSGHMLARYRERYDADRALIGIDLSPAMVTLTKALLGDAASVHAGDMRGLKGVEPQSIAAVISFYALHHLSPGQVQPALEEWKRTLVPGGQLLLATWEGQGPIDYGEQSDVVAFRLQEGDVRRWCEAAGFRIDRCQVAPVEGMGMDAIHLEATRI